jgi:hypothetical protein
LERHHSSGTTIFVEEIAREKSKVRSTQILRSRLLRCLGRKRRTRLRIAIRVIVINY